jgi:uncharacterized membrane protein HdeD (DUF308 family)
VTVTFLAGASTLAAAAIALFFLRFWRDTRDRLFLLFAIAFAVFAANRLALTILDDEGEGRTLIYLARAGAFGLIIAAVVDKNRGR